MKRKFVKDADTGEIYILPNEKEAETNAASWITGDFPKEQDEIDDKDEIIAALNKKIEKLERKEVKEKDAAIAELNKRIEKLEKKKGKGKTDTEATHLGTVLCITCAIFLLLAGFFQYANKQTVSNEYNVDMENTQIIMPIDDERAEIIAEEKLQTEEVNTPVAEAETVVNEETQDDENEQKNGGALDEIKELDLMGRFTAIMLYIMFGGGIVIAIKAIWDFIRDSYNGY